MNFKNIVKGGFVLFTAWVALMGCGWATGWFMDAGFPLWLALPTTVALWAMGFSLVFGLAVGLFGDEENA